MVNIRQFNIKILSVLIIFLCSSPYAYAEVEVGVYIDSASAKAACEAHYFQHTGVPPGSGGCRGAFYWTDDAVVTYRFRIALGYCGTNQKPSLSTGQCLPIPPNPNGGPPNCPAGNPISIATGNKYQEEIDYISEGPMPVKITRYYNSDSGDFGGWSFGSDNKLIFNLDAIGDVNSIMWVVGNGVTRTFLSGTNGWNNQASPLLRLNKDVDGNWVLVDENELSYLFDVNGRLQFKKDKYGNQQSFLYDSYGRITYLTDQSGAAILSFGFDVLGNIKQIRVGSSDTFRYTWDRFNLVSVQYPNSDVPNKTYHYENPNFPNALTGITDENNIRYATWDYDAQGRGVLSEHANGAERATLVFNPDDSTSVTNPLGKVTTYYFQDINGLKKVTRVEGHPTAYCLGANKNYTYNSAGLLETKTDWKNSMTRFSYNSRDLEAQRIEAEGTPEEKRITTTWHATFNLPLEIIEPKRITRFSYDQQGREISRVVENYNN